MVSGACGPNDIQSFWALLREHNCSYIAGPLPARSSVSGTWAEAADAIAVFFFGPKVFFILGPKGPTPGVAGGFAPQRLLSRLWAQNASRLYR